LKNKAVTYFVMFLVTVVGSMVLLLLLEGMCSFLSSTKTAFKKRVLRERQFTRYDAELGWTSIPNVVRENIYGPGTSVQVNSQGFRATETFTKEVPAGRKRVLCSGDSFTFGNGVNGNETWCAYLEKEFPNLQSINLGQGGYGIDQAYLRYKREMDSFDHQLHVLAFIKDDFLRAERSNFQGYGKPFLSLKNGNEIFIGNVPVPRWPIEWPKLTTGIQAAKQIVGELKLVHALNAVRTKLVPNANRLIASAENSKLELAKALFADLDKLAKAKQKAVVFMYIPTYDELVANKPSVFREELSEMMKSANLNFVDTTPDFFDLPTLEKAEQYLMTPFGTGHMSAGGNRKLSVALARFLKERGLAPVSK